MPHPSDDGVSRGQEPRGPVRLSQLGGVDEATPEATRRLNAALTLATVEFLGAVIAVAPPFSVVLPGWASMRAPEGCR